VTTTTTPPRPQPESRTRKVLAISLGILAALLVAFFFAANLLTDFLWFDQLGFEEVLLTQWIARIVMFLVGFVAMALPVWLSIQLAYRTRPVYARLSSQLGRYQEAIEPLRRLAMWGIPVFFGFFAGFAASSTWETTWLWFNGVSTDVVDPQFGLDTGFYMFALPFYSSALGFASAVLIVCLLVTAVVAYLYGAVRAGQRELRISKSARIQLAIIAGLYLVVQAVSLWLDRYLTLVQTGESMTGATYTGANAVIPGQAILAAIAAIVAILFFVTAVIGRWRFPLIGTALLVISAVVVGVGYPYIVQTFQVRPNEFAYEQQYIQRNIDATREAYGVAEMTKEPFTPVVDTNAGTLRNDAETTANIRIMDPAIIPPTVRQQQQVRPYYAFADTLDVDRYELDGEVQDTLVSVRELNQRGLSSATWQNTAVVYTHGYGLVAAYGNQRSSDGYPLYLEGNIPTSGTLSDTGKFEPRVYFGENSPLYSIVGAPEGSTPLEMDYPRGEEGSSETKTTFDGDGGPRIGSMFPRLLYSLKFQSTDILLSEYVNDESQILYDRDPKLRVQKAAPYLTLDNDPYPSVVDGRIVWIVDGYTTSASYPYSNTVSLQRAIADSTNVTPRIAVDNINYIRNSVKATVDAYDGSVTLYAWDENDPVLEAWQKVYPTTLEPISEMSADLMSHVRYPTDLFKVQRSILGEYHVTDAQSFYQSDNRWVTPPDPQIKTELQPPYYLTMQMPGQETPTFSMFSSFIPAASGTETRNVLTGYLAVDSNAGSTAGVKSEDYGKLRMLALDADPTVPGPGQVQNTFNSDQNVSSQINLLKQGQTQVLNGNLLTLPVGGGLLYVQPVFVQSSGETSFPALRKVLVAFGEKIAFEDTLDEALDSLFGGDSGASAGDGGVSPVAPPTEPGETPAPQPSPGPPVSGDAMSVALEEARVAMADRDAALKAGDFAAFGEADARLTKAVEKLLALNGE
jgi:hypothetical protein